MWPSLSLLIKYTIFTSLKNKQDSGEGGEDVWSILREHSVLCEISKPNKLIYF